VSFSAATLRFLRGLTAHNNKPWFEAHRDDYEAAVKVPMQALIEEMDVRLARFAPEIVGDPKRSMFRINRDIRFSADKSPYKTHASCWFYHRDGSRGVGREAEGGGAGFYFQIAPGDSFTGGGMWMPPKDALAKIREAIADSPRAFEKIAGSPKLKLRFSGLDDEGQLKRVPRGYAPDHPAGEWLRLQSFVSGRRLTDAQAVGGRLVALLEADFQVLLPLVRWINGTLGLRPATRR
jgi:uncharacterized protein (TIGR02453 family)